MPPVDSSLYFSMLKDGKAITKNEGKLPEVRVAILANYATQQFVHVLKAALSELGFFPHVFAAEYDTAALEVYNPDSSLFAFEPDFVFLGAALQHYRDRFFACRTPDERERLPDHYSEELVGIAKTLHDKKIPVLLTNLVLPVERMFGNYGVMTRHSLYGSVLAINQLFQKAATQKWCSRIDVIHLAAVHGIRSFIDEKLWVSSKYLCANKYLPELARSVAGTIGVRKGKVKKCLVLDLDNTLWGGVIGDDGIDGIQLGHGNGYGEAFQLFQSYILSLKHRGFILAVCSKNTDEVARNVFRNHPDMILREDDIAVFFANWSDKAGNIEYIAKTLNIGLDSLVFIDDSPFERNLVRSILPMVAVPEMPEEVTEYISTIEESGLLEASAYSKEDFERNQMYREEAIRATEQIKFSNLDEYLQSLEIVVSCGPFTHDEVPRVAQLLQRSNQFNLRTQRFDERACSEFMSSPNNYFTFSARLRDRFGDYGLIAVICGEVKGDTLDVTELVMSCRVLKRGMEEFMINKLVQYCREKGLKNIRGEYIPTSKNGMVKEFYPGFGFVPTTAAEGRSAWALNVNTFSPLKTFISEERQ